MRRLFRPRLGRYLGLLALIGTLLTVPATAASAATRMLSESFEGSSAYTWTFEGDPYCQFCGEVDDFKPWAHTGAKSAFIRTYSPVGSWFSVGKLVHLQRNNSCQARVYVLRVGTVNVEVIDPSTWTYLALGTISSGESYQLQSLNWWGGPTDVYFRVSIVSTPERTDGWANVDDITIDCS
jgi:hypothetical protein